MELLRPRSPTALSLKHACCLLPTILVATAKAQLFTLTGLPHQIRPPRNLRRLNATWHGPAAQRARFFAPPMADKPGLPPSSPAPNRSTFRDVEAFNENDAYLLAAGPGATSRIYKTNDAGAHWTLQLKNEDPRRLLRLHDILGRQARHSPRRLHRRRVPALCH